MSIDIKLRRPDKTYTIGDTVRGVVVVTTQGRLSHQGITLTAEGGVKLDLSAKSVGLFEAFYSNSRPLELLKCSFEVTPAGRFEDGIWEIPFEFTLLPLEGCELFDSYHGVFVNIRYLISVEMTRGMLHRNLRKSIEFVVRSPPVPKIEVRPVSFEIVPQALRNVKKSSIERLPDFRISGSIDSVICDIRKPFSGSVTIHRADTRIRSIELQLVRVETIATSEGKAKEATEIQNIQVAEDDVCREMDISLHMIFPRLFTSPSVGSTNFKVEFEVNLIVLLEDGYQITENFPIRLVRGK